jgi:hypothetical protein
MQDLKEENSLLFFIQTLIILAKPKSAILTVLLSPTRTFRAARSIINIYLYQKP